ncbi:MAG: transcription-repair coupling factor [Eubacteriales bacterium]
MHNQIYEQLFKDKNISCLNDMIRGGQTPCSVFSVSDGLRPFLLKGLSESTGRQILYITQNDYLALTMKNRIENSIFFPERDLQLRPGVIKSQESTQKRIQALLSVDSAQIVTAGLSAFTEKLIPKSTLYGATIKISSGATFNIDDIINSAISLGYERISNVETAGQIARRGDILDFSPKQDKAYRISFFMDNVEKINSFDMSTQRSNKEELDSVYLTAMTEAILDEMAINNAKKYFLDELKRVGKNSEYSLMSAKIKEYLDLIENSRSIDDMRNYIYAIYPPTSLIDYLNNPIVIFDSFSSLVKVKEIKDEEFVDSLFMLKKVNMDFSGQQELFFSLNELLIKDVDFIDFCSIKKSSLIQSVAEINLNSRNVIRYDGRLDLLKEDLINRANAGFTTYLFCSKENRIKTLKNALKEPLANGKAILADGEIKMGFELAAQKINVLSEEDIFGSKKSVVKTQKQGNGLDIFDLSVGDIVVHTVYGRAKYLGIKTQTVDKKTCDYIILSFLGDDKLYIPTAQIDKIQKYVGTSDNPPRLSRLGSREWANQKTKAKESLKKLAGSLLLVYAERQSKQGFSYGEDTVWQREFEQAFEYEETPGQLRAIEEIKADMEGQGIMDRLLLGDVGYGKTEVAARACFKAVSNKKQCAILTPTTLLCRQHYETFKKRFKNFGFNIAMLSRFVSPAEAKKNIASAANGNTDIVIGTHRLLSKDVRFHDLGLLIIDEEQRFGVNHKEKIKQLKRTVDVLTMTATPIPRTLEMSMIGIRDLSTIDTPIEERLPVQTYVSEFSVELLTEAILKEKQRGGQVFLVVRHISLMDDVASMIKDNIPDATFLMAHGRMDKDELEDVMEKFISGEYDVLICTTIIESGIDMPKVNTIVVYEADKFGLAQLYQLRGRVGRSYLRAYAYFTYIKDDYMTMDAEKRLMTIKEFTELGAGFKIALRDLKIRGAGNLLGAEQSGHMNTIGYEMYLKYMKEAVSELKGNPIEIEKETTIEVNLDAHISASYIEDEKQRLEIYKRIASISDMNSAKELKEELADRFGKVIKPVENLIIISLLRLIASKKGIESIIQKRDGFYIKFFYDTQLDTSIFMGALERYGSKVSIRQREKPYFLNQRKNR